MVSNNDVTLYHKVLDENRLEKWVTYNFDNVWVYGRKGSLADKGLEDANNVDVRITLDKVDDTEVFSLGDIIALGHLEDIEWQSQLEGQDFYKIVSVNVNNFGSVPHIHLRGK